MTNNKCLFCYKALEKNEIDFHPRCSRKIFGQPSPPELLFTEDQLRDLALKVLQSQTVITGVQPKLSLRVEGDKTKNENRFTIVGALGKYILKPQTSQYPTAPEVEDLTMHLATLSKIKTVPHSLIRMRSGKLAYITKRVDRIKNLKIHMEDMCQLTGRLTEDKYKGSYEQIAKTILKYSNIPGLDVINFFEQVLFCFLTGNADMHLKNFSLINVPSEGIVLSPAYDMLSTKLVLPADDEDLALTLNAKKKKITRKDFEAAFSKANLAPGQIDNLFKKMSTAIPKWLDFINISFLEAPDKETYKKIILERKQRLEL